MGWHRGDQEPARGAIGKVMEKSHKNGTAQVPGQLICLFINKIH